MVVLATLLLVSVAAVAMTAETRAAKTWPTVSNPSGICTPGATTNDFIVSWTIEGKGRWAYIEVERFFDQTGWVEHRTAGTKVDMHAGSTYTAGNSNVPNTWTNPEYQARITNNKGVAQGPWVSTGTISCAA